MPLTNLERLRLQIADRPRVVLRETVGVGDAATRSYLLTLAPVVDDSETVVVGVVVKVPGIDYTLDQATGLLVFTSAPASAAQIVATYTWTVFSDAELDDLLVAKGLGVTRAAIQALQWLLADTDRFLKYTFGQESVDRSAAREGIQDLLARLEAQTSRGAVSLVKADTPCREALMHPFIQQPELDCA